MRLVQYEYKTVESVPLYDPDSDTYQIAVEGDIIELSSDLFHKLFEEVGQLSPSQLVKQKHPKLMGSAIKRIEEDKETPFIVETRTYLKELIRDLKDVYSLGKADMLSEFEKEISRKGEYMNVGAYKQLFDTLYDEVEEEDKDNNGG